MVSNMKTSKNKVGFGFILPNVNKVLDFKFTSSYTKTKKRNGGTDYENWLCKGKYSGAE